MVGDCADFAHWSNARGLKALAQPVVSGSGGAVGGKRAKMSDNREAQLL